MIKKAAWNSFSDEIEKISISLVTSPLVKSLASGLTDRAAVRQASRVVPFRPRPSGYSGIGTQREFRLRLGKTDVGSIHASKGTYDKHVGSDVGKKMRINKGDPAIHSAEIHKDFQGMGLSPILRKGSASLLPKGKLHSDSIFTPGGRASARRLKGPGVKIHEGRAEYGKPLYTLQSQNPKPVVGKDLSSLKTPRFQRPDDHPITTRKKKTHDLEQSRRKKGPIIDWRRPGSSTLADVERNVIKGKKAVLKGESARVGHNKDPLLVPGTPEAKSSLAQYRKLQKQIAAEDSARKARKLKENTPARTIPPLLLPSRAGKPSSISVSPAYKEEIRARNLPVKGDKASRGVKTPSPSLQADWLKERAFIRNQESSVKGAKASNKQKAPRQDSLFRRSLRDIAQRGRRYRDLFRNRDSN